jgi:hypothetical protein
MSLPKSAPDAPLLNYSEEAKKPTSVSCREMTNLSLSQGPIQPGLQHLRDCNRNRTFVNCERASFGLAAIHRSSVLDAFAPHKKAAQLAHKERVDRLPLRLFGSRATK